MEPTSTPVNDGLAGVESQQQKQPATEQAQGVPAAVAEQQPKPEQTPEQNAVFAEMRRRAQSEANAAAAQEWQAKLDAFAADVFAEDGIKTYDEYQERVRNAQIQQQYGVDPAQLKPLFDEWKRSDPDFVQAREAAFEAQAQRDAQALGAEFPESGVKAPADLEKLPHWDDILKKVEGGYSLRDAYYLVNATAITEARIKSAVNDALTKTAANSAASSGPLGDGADTPRHYTEAEIDRMSVKQIMANYDAVMASHKRNTKG
jgi:hypothetical protein